MPKRKYAGGSTKSSKRARSRKIYRAKRKAVKSAARVTTIVRAPGPLPPRMVTKHKYVEEFNTDGVHIDQMYNLNSTYSPTYGGGHQPYGRDTYASLYGRYRVFAVRYKIFFSTTSSAGTVFRGLANWNNSTSTVTNWGLEAERPGSRTVEFGFNTPRYLKGHLTLSRITGVTPVQYKTDDRFQALAGSDPTEKIMLHVITTDNAGNSIASGVGQIRVELKFYTEWFDPLNLAQS